MPITSILLRRSLLWLLAGAGIAGLGGCVLLQAPAPPGTVCASALFRVDDGFDGARRGACRVKGDRHLVLTIAPEDEGYINDSAWFAMRIEPLTPAATTATIELRYRGGHHRYLPKLSIDGRTWSALEPSQIRVDKKRRRAQFEVELAGRPLWIAAQELVLPLDDTQWAHATAASVGATVQELGKSRGQRPVMVMASGGGQRELVLLVGRQHPPEVSGAFAFKGFVEALFDDSSLARSFRERFGVIAIPMMNPDGVVAGHWRHNLDGQDLNRDWGPFTQPETQLIRELLDNLDAQQRRVAVFLDFHSTRRNLFYTQPDHDTSEPTDFALRWLDAARPRLIDYPFSHERRHNEGLPTSKNYVNERYGIPAITYEVGDETDRAAARAAAGVFAQEMMRLLLDTPE